jgi:hypothetical protein
LNPGFSTEVVCPEFLCVGDRFDLNVRLEVHDRREQSITIEVKHPKASSPP